MNKKILSLFLALALLFTLAACGSHPPDPGSQGPSQPATPPLPSNVVACGVSPDMSPPQVLDIAVGTLNGNTGIAAAWLMEQSAQGRTQDNYSFQIATAPDQVVSMLLSDQVQIAALPTNVAAMLYNRSDGMIQLAAITAYGVLHILENGNEIHAIEDLRGRTIHTTGQGANPEFILNHVLTRHGLTPGYDVQIEFHANEALAAQMAAGQITLSMMPEPMVQSVLAQNEHVRVALDMTDAWNAVGDGSSLVMSALVVRTDFAEQHPEAVHRFLDLLQTSIHEANTNPEEVGALIAQFEIMPNPQIAARAIPGSNLTFLTGHDMEPTITGYFQVLLTAYPAAIGGALPSENFYFISP